MTNKKILELILNTCGLNMKKFELIRNGGSMVGYEFEVYQNDIFQFDVATDSFEDAVRETLEYIYGTENITFNKVRWE